MDIERQRHHWSSSRKPFCFSFRSSFVDLDQRTNEETSHSSRQSLSVSSSRKSRRVHEHVQMWPLGKHREMRRWTLLVRFVSSSAVSDCRSVVMNSILFTNHWRHSVKRLELSRSIWTKLFIKLRHRNKLLNISNPMFKLFKAARNWRTRSLNILNANTFE